MNKGFKYTQSLFRLFVIFMFVMISTMLVVLGANVYGSISQTMDNNAVIRTASGYITNKNREYGSRLYVEDKMLIVENEYEGEKYLSRIYYDEGFLKESFLPEGYEFDRESGEIITALDGFDIIEKNGFIEITMTQGQNTVKKRIGEV